jgi:hypothetical protein
MNTSIGPHEHYALVSPQDFSGRMDIHWTERLQLVTSPALRTLWGIVASTFRTSIINSINGVVDAPWLILQPPTGSGKTQGACVFAAMQADANAQGAHKPVGILIVTRRIEQAEEIATTINKLAGRVVAATHYRDKPATDQELFDSDALIITHQAYVNAVEHLGSHKDAPWTRFIAWRGGKRLLTIIDEALANVVEDNRVTATDLAQVLSYITPEMRREFPEQLKVLEELQSILVQYADPKTRTDNRSTRMLWDDTDIGIQLPDMDALRLAMKRLQYDTLVLNENNDGSRKRIAKKVDDTLRGSQAVMEQWAYYHQKGQEHSINSSSFLIPWNLPGPVVLDATANANFLWNLFGPKAQVVPTPSKVRDYSPVRLHVARTAAGLGKGSMIEKAKTRVPRLLAALEGELDPDRSVFMCMHKDTKHTALSYEHHFARLDVGHWGAIDGRNDWSINDVAVIFGLPYRGQVWSTNLFFALQGHQDDYWLQHPGWNEYDDVRQVMEQRQLSVSIIQAINRVCCRRVIDAQGRSPPADILIILPQDKTGDAILKDIVADMPELNVVPWLFELDGPQVRKARKGTSHEALITYMSTRLPGETSMSKVQRELGLDGSKLKKLKASLSKADHQTTTALRNIGVSYVVRGVRRGARAYLIKAQAA